MITHIVMWKLKDHAEGSSKADNAAKMKLMLEALKDKISVIRHIEAGINSNRSDAAFDVALYSVFDSLEDMSAYQNHPEHKKVAEFVSHIWDKRAVVDYES